MSEGTVWNREIDAICDWISDYVKSAGSTGVAIGLSGGIDSSLVAALCAKALGAANVKGVSMPCQSSPDDQEMAEMIVNHLGIDYECMSLLDLFETMRSTIGVEELPLLTQANIKARLRMTAIYAVASLDNRLVAGTGNKTEHKIGYFTKHGDGGTDFEPICDYYKTEVYELARTIGLPEVAVTRTPSAGLWEGQTDEGELGIVYEKLDEILKVLEKLHGPDEQIIRNITAVPSGVTFEQYCSIADRVEKNAHKTKLPPYYKRR